MPTRESETKTNPPQIPDVRTNGDEVPELLDWDAHIETPPPRPSGTIKVRLNGRGRDTPIPVEVPADDEA